MNERIEAPEQSAEQQQQVNETKRIKTIARKKLKMSSGKLAAQSVHAALALAAVTPLHPMMSVIVLETNEAPFNRAKEQSGSSVAIIRDAGYTEVDPGTETCLAYLEPDPRLT